MDQFLTPPKARSRKRALMLPILLGLTVLLYVVILVPVRDTAQITASTATP